MSSTGSCFRRRTVAKSWQIAEGDCLAWGGHLASLNRVELTFLDDSGLLPGSETAWTGGKWIHNDIDPATYHWEWLDGEPWVEQDVPWYGLPNHAIGDCVALLDPNGLVTNACENELPFLCERKP